MNTHKRIPLQIVAPFASQQRGLKRTVSNPGGGASIPWVSSTAFASKTGPSAGGGPQPRNAESAQGYGGGSGSILSAASDGSRHPTESSCDNGNDVMQAADTAAASSLSTRNAPNPAVADEVTTSEAVGSMMGARKSRGAATVMEQGEENTGGVGCSFGTRGLLGGGRSRSRGGSSSFSMVAGRGRRDVSFSGEGEAPEPAEPAAVAAAATTTQGRVGMRKARRTYGR